MLHINPNTVIACIAHNLTQAGIRQYVAENHQYKNAKTLADADAATLVEEKELEEGRLTTAVCELLASNAHLREQETQIASFAREDACSTIWQDIQKLCAK